VAELVGVDHRPDGLDLAVGDVEREYADYPVLRVVGHRAGLAVDQDCLGADSLPLDLAEQPEQEPGHAVAAGQRLSPGLPLGAAVTHHDHVGREQLEQASQVAAADGFEEPARNLVALLA